MNSSRNRIDAGPRTKPETNRIRNKSNTGIGISLFRSSRYRGILSQKRDFLLEVSAVLVDGPVRDAPTRPGAGGLMAGPETRRKWSPST
ncbi:hypothetical protein EVAR_95149_1 [Eumeta japonica]|uniref:Uncharacterized protein n=1 Tax=Eumeta variegata TaxID=151549 RepID=A0A4C1W7E7_EUMVA|nr:hypothetical protein EVAR_95149_1 [Eumeta japonica]